MPRKPPFPSVSKARSRVKELEAMKAVLARAIDDTATPPRELPVLVPLRGGAGAGAACVPVVAADLPRARSLHYADTPQCIRRPLSITGSSQHYRHV